MKSLYDQLDQNALRMEQIILLAGMLSDGEAMADPLRDLLEDESDKTIRQCFPDMPEQLLQCRDSDGDCWTGEFFQWAIGAEKFGFLVQFARPVMRYFSGGNLSSYSWGHYATFWAYGDTLETAVAKGLEWSQQRERDEKEKAAQAATEGCAA